MAKKVAKKKRSKKVTKKSASSTPKVTKEEKVTYQFCRLPIHRYIPATTKPSAFRNGDVKQLKFHRKTPPHSSNGLAVEIEIFAKRLDLFMLAYGFAGKVGARDSIRGAIAAAEDPMRKLLDVMNDNYRE